MQDKPERKAEQQYKQARKGQERDGVDTQSHDKRDHRLGKREFQKVVWITQKQKKMACKEQEQTQQKR
jgi:hypothetical protein